MPIRAVTFDFHNTLARCDAWFILEVRDLVPAVLKWHANGSGVAVDGEVLDRSVALYRTLRLQVMDHGEEVDALDCVMHVLAELELKIDRETADAGIHAVMQATLAESEPIPGVIDAVNYLADCDIPLGVVSSAVYHPFLEWSLEKFGIIDQFTSIVTSASAGYYKSRTEIYTHSLTVLGVEPFDAVHVGDSHRFDVQTAKRLGIRTVWYRTGEDDGMDDEADLTVTSLVGVAPRIIDQFGAGR